MKKIIGIIMIFILIALTGCSGTRDEVKTYLHDVWELEESYELVEIENNKFMRALNVYIRDDMNDLDTLCLIYDNGIQSFINGENAAELVVDKNREFKEYIIMNGKSMEQKGFDPDDLLEEVKDSIRKHSDIADGFRTLQMELEKINIRC